MALEVEEIAGGGGVGVGACAAEDFGGVELDVAGEGDAVVGEDWSRRPNQLPVGVLGLGGSDGGRRGGFGWIEGEGGGGGL